MDEKSSFIYPFHTFIKIRTTEQTYPNGTRTAQIRAFTRFLPCAACSYDRKLVCLIWEPIKICQVIRPERERFPTAEVSRTTQARTTDMSAPMMTATTATAKAVRDFNAPPPTVPRKTVKYSMYVRA